MNLSDKINAEKEYIRNLWINPSENYKTELLNMKREIIEMIEKNTNRDKELMQQKEYFLNLQHYLKDREDTQDIENIIKDIDLKLKPK